MAISSLLGYEASENGHTEARVLTPGQPFDLACYQGTFLPQSLPTSPVQTAKPAALPQPPIRLAPARNQTGTTLRDLLIRYRRECNHLAASTRTKMECHFTVAARLLDFSHDVSAITLAQLRELKSKLCDGRKPASVNDILYKGLGLLFRMAVDDGLIERSPLDRLTRVKQREPERKDLPWKLAQDIEQEVGRFAKESAIIIGVMRNFGVGQAEIKHLLGEHVDLEKGVVHFRRKKTGKSFDVPIYPQTLAFLEQMRADGRLQAGKPVVTWRNPRKALESACDRLKFPRYEPRAFRRAFIVFALERGVEPRVVAHWQGHKDAGLILKVYGKFIHAEHDKIQAEKLARV